jgi:S-adenosylmethionine:tRNA ribosyltransferase-isomerase
MELEATEPPEARGLARDDVRLMVSHLRDDSIQQARFRDIAGFLRPGDVIVVNTSATINAALDARTSSGRALELHLSTRLSARDWVIELRTPGPKGTTPFFDTAPGDRIALPADGAATITSAYSRGRPARLWRATLDLPKTLPRYLAEHGFPIRYSYVRERWPLEYYQTAFGTEAGSAEMPSAGRGFTPQLITQLVARGIEVVPVLLHTGVASLEANEQPYPEYFRVSEQSARRLTTARTERRRILAIGTTVVRTLETVTDPDGVTHSGQGWTDVVVTTVRPVRGVNGILTGFHEPRASHLVMLSAIAGCAHLRKTYEAALREGYLWHEFGDAHLILPD